MNVGNSMTEDEKEDALISAWMLQNADRIRHGSRLAELEQRCKVGDDRISTKPNKVYELIVSNEERSQCEQLRYSPGSGSRSSGNSGGISRLARNLAAVAATDRNFAGNVPEIGAFGMPLEQNMANVKPLPQFQVHLGNYCGQTYKGYDDMKCLITQMVDPVSTLASKQPKRPKKPTYEVVINIGR